MPDPVIMHNRVMNRGMADKVAPWLVDEGYAVYLENAEIFKPGECSRRLGVTSIGGHAASPQGLWRFYDLINEKEILHAAHGGKIFKLNGTSMVQIASGASLVGNLHDGHEGFWGSKRAVYVTMAESRPDMYNDQASKIVAITWDGSDISQCASMAPACAEFFQYRLWCGWNFLSAAESSDTLWWSELNDGLSYSLTNSIRIEPGVGGVITGLVGIRTEPSSLIIFKQRAIARLIPVWGDSGGYIPGAADALDTINSQVTMISKNVGCCAPRSIQWVPGAATGDLIFLSYEGFRTIRRAEQDVVVGASPPISDQIQDTIDRINFSYAHKISSVVHGTRYFCAVPLDGATENTHVIVYDLVPPGSWSVYTWAVRDMAVSLLNETKDYLFLQSNTATADSGATGLFTGYHIYKAFNGYQDPGGDAIRVQVDTRGMMPANDITVKSKWDWVGISLKNTAGATCAATVCYNIDRAGWVTAGSLVFNATFSTVTLGETPLPWESNLTSIQTKYLSLVDAPPGYEIQIRYIIDDDFAAPSVLDVAVKATPIGNEIDNSIA